MKAETATPLPNPQSVVQSNVSLTADEGPASDVSESRQVLPRTLKALMVSSRARHTVGCRCGVPANSLTKVALAWTTGGTALGKLLAGGVAAALVAGAIGLWVAMRL